VVVHHRDEVDSASEFVVDVPDVGGPVLVPSPRGERHHSLLPGWSFRFFETIELTMGKEYPPAGSGTEVYPYLRQCSVDTVFAEVGVLLLRRFFRNR
jgi:hypothetical protein